MKILIKNQNIEEKLLNLSSSNQRLSLKRFLNFTDGIFDISLLNPFKEFLIHETNLKNSTISVHIFRLKGLVKKILDSSFDLSIKEKYLIERKIKEIKAPAISNKIITNEKMLSEIEMKLLIENSPKTISFLLRFVKITGARITESLNLTFHKCKIHNDYVVCELLGKGDKYRNVRIPLSLFKEIKENSYSDSLFFSTSSKKRLSRQYIDLTLKKIGKKYLNKNVSAHMFRHSFATSKIRQTGKIKAVSSYLGHSSVSTTLDMYTHESLANNELF